MDTWKIDKTVIVQEDVDLPEYIIFKLVEIRKARGLSQEDLAVNIGLNRTSIVNIECGRQRLSINNLYLICKFLNIKSSKILPF